MIVNRYFEFPEEIDKLLSKKTAFSDLAVLDPESSFGRRVG
jgi:hypothetical protein